ncbi:MAG: hypothetical protein IJP68_00135, partial [Selenomonadaceae bacterium]|nr:hypothetical protein [Selenomonadaceae bacterium]
EVNNKALIKLGEGKNSLSSHNDKNSTIIGGSGNDRLIFYNATNLSVNAGDGDNQINFGDLSYSINSSKNKILAGKGNDTINDNSIYGSINAGAGDDSIKHVGANSTILGGKGNDWIDNDDGQRDYGHDTSISAYTLIDGGNGNDTLQNSCNSVTLLGGSGNDYLSTGGTDKVSIDGGSGNDTIYNVTDINIQLSTNSTLIGGAGNDSIYNTGSNSTISGGTGNDTISLGTALAGRRPARYEVGGENILINYTNGDGFDLIQGFDSKATLLISGSEYSTKESGDDLIVTVGKGKITLEGAVGLSVPNIASDYVKVTDSTKSPVTVGSSIKTIDASTRTKAVKITGNKLDNSISGGSDNDKLYGGKGDDYLSGGKGNDSLWGDDGADTFYYAKGDGKDIIYGFDSKDTLTFDNLDFTTSYSASKGKIVFSVDGGSVTLKDFTATTFHINDDIYKISGSKLKKQ